MDVWSLFATIANLHRGVPWLSCFNEPYELETPPVICYAEERVLCQYDIMAPDDPVDRASAAQFLFVLYAGKGICSQGPITNVSRKAPRAGPPRVDEQAGTNIDGRS